MNMPLDTVDERKKREEEKKEEEKERRGWKKREEAKGVASSRLIRDPSPEVFNRGEGGGEAETIRGDRMAGRFLFSF